MEKLVQIIAVVVLLTNFSSAQDSFEKNCIPCHKKLDISLRKSFMKALLVYGGEENMKAGLSYFFRNPNAGISVMDDDYIKKNGIMKPLSIEKKVLNKALSIYWEKYTVIGRIE